MKQLLLLQLLLVMEFTNILFTPQDNRQNYYAAL